MSFALVAKIGPALTLLQKLAATGVHSASQTLELRNALEPLIGQANACVLAAWVGGAPSHASLSFSDARQSAEEACGTRGWFSSDPSVADARKALRDVDPELERLVAQLGEVREAKGAAQLDQQASEDAKKIAKEAAAAAAPAVGATLVIALVAIAVYAVAKGAAS